MRHALMAGLLFVAASPAFAASVEFDIACDPLASNCQTAFNSVIKDIGAGLNQKALVPAEATGLTGFGIGALVSYAPVSDKQAWRTLTGSGVDEVGMVGVVLHKGLPFGIDLGAFYSTVPGTDVDVIGGELRYALLEGGVASPGVALRASYTTTRGIEDFDYDAWGADISVSKGFTFLTPYVGAGYSVSNADPKGANAQAAGLRKAEIDRGRVFAGLRMSLMLLELTPEYERLGSNDVFSLRLGLSF